MAITRKQTDAKVTAVLVGLVALDDNGLTGALHATRMGQLGALMLVLPQKIPIGSCQWPKNIAVKALPGGMPQLIQLTMSGTGVAVGADSTGVQTLTTTANVPSADWLVPASLRAHCCNLSTACSADRVARGLDAGGHGCDPGGFAATRIQALGPFS